ncbi:MAG: C39 family peptidase [Chloroflexota bacterium]
MPNVLLPVPHFEQSRDGTCLPTCARMVLAHWGQSYSEADLAVMLDAKPYGVPISNIKHLQQHGYQVEFGSLTIEQLQSHLLAGHPIIARVWTIMLDYWPDEVTSHVVVVVGFDETDIYLNDQTLSKAPQLIVWNGFLAAWAEFDEMAAVVYPF